MADHQQLQARSVERTSSNTDSSDASSASHPTDGTEDGQTDDGSDRDSVTSELSTQDYKVSLKDDIREALDRIKVAGSFASFRKLPHTPPAGLHVDGVGNIAMPLGETQARQLIAKARQAPYGRGTETIVDTSVRNTWEIDAAQFSFNDQRWPDYVRGLCAKVATDLGIMSSIRAEIYKMLIYERGAMFKSHTDTEKIPGQFGTLVVALPSAHKGGDVVVKHCGERKTFKTSEHGQSFICWYSDVHHKVCPVESGYRWVLTYNLALDPNVVRPSAGLVRSETEALRHTLRKWLQNPEESRHKGLYYILDHHYTEASIKLNNLNSRDLAVGQVLDSLSKELDFEVFFALLEKEEVGVPEPEVEHLEFCDACRENGGKGGEEKCSHSMQDTIDLDYRVITVRDVFGKPVVDGLPLDAEKDILQDDDGLFDDNDPDQEQYEGYMGNWGPTVTHWHRLTAILLVPSASIFEFFNSDVRTLSNKNCRSLISNCARSSLSCLGLNMHRATLLFQAVMDLYDHLWSPNINERPDNRSKHEQMDGNDVMNILKVALELGEYDFFDDACSWYAAIVPTSFFTWAKQWLKESNTDTCLNDITTGELGLTCIVETYPNLSDKLAALTNLIPKPEEADWSASLRDKISTWVHDRLKDCLKDLLREQKVGGSEGRTMIEMALIVPDPSRFLSTSLIPLLDPARHSIAFFIALLARLWKEISAGVISRDDGIAIYKTIANRFLASADFSKAEPKDNIILSEPGNKRQRTSYHGSNKNSTTKKLQVQTTVAFETLVNLYVTLVKISSSPDDDFATRLITKLNDAVPRLPVDHMDNLWLPFLWSLIPILTTNPIPLTMPVYQSLYRSMLTRYIIEFVGEKPAPSTSLVRPRVHCSLIGRTCTDCSILNGFLQSSAERVAYFEVSTKRRHHLHQMLEEHGVDCTHVSERNTYPRTLVVTKTFRQDDQPTKEWKERKASAEKKLSNFEAHSPSTPELRVLLGEQFDRIMSMEDVYPNSAGTRRTATATATATASRPLASASGHNVVGGSRVGASGLNRSWPAPVAGVKRSRNIGLGDGAEIVDLTDD